MTHRSGGHGNDVVGVVVVVVVVVGLVVVMV